MDSKFYFEQNFGHETEKIENALRPKDYDITDHEPINVYLVAHSHLDPGWIDTFEDYYIKKVRDILINVIITLSKDKTRKFTWCETSFLLRFWKDDDPSVTTELKQALEQLMKDKRI